MNQTSTPKAYYEQPLTKPVRLFLRFEQLINRFEVGVDGDTTTSSHIAMLALLDLYQHSMHVDIKAEVLREIDRLQQLITHPRNHILVLEPSDIAEIEAILKSGAEQTHAIAGQVGGRLRNHHFFNLIRQRITMPGGVNSFDLPIYHHWISQPPEDRKALLLRWAEPYYQLNTVISDLLIVLRGYYRTETLIAEQGFIQQPIESNDTCQMLRIGLPQEARYYPEVSSGRQRFSIRFFEPSDLSERPSQTRDDVTFEAMYCGI